MKFGSSLMLCVGTFLILCIPSRADFETDFLLSHNMLRKSHGCPRLVYSRTLNANCASYAKEIADKDSMDHSAANGAYGENLCFTTQNPLECIKMWYSEIKDYDYDNPSFSPATGHFTQLIWRGSLRLGVGNATSADGKHYVVARYSPAGNVAGQFKENVPKPGVGFDFDDYFDDGSSIHPTKSLFKHFIIFLMHVLIVF